MSDNGPTGGNPPSPINVALAEQIGRELRNVRGQGRMSDQELGRRIGVSKNTIQRLMAGEADFDMVRLFRIADVLGIAPEELVRRARLAAGMPACEPFDPSRGGPPAH